MQAVAEAVRAEQKPTTPDAPPFVVQCLEKGAKARAARKAKTGKQPTADELTLGEVMTSEERAKCGKALMNWYQSIQKANALQKVASAK